MANILVSEYNNLSRFHFIKRAKLRKQIYNEILKECSSYQEFSKKCPIPFDKFLIIGLCMSEGKTVSLEQQNWYMAEQQRRAAEEIKNTIENFSRRNEDAINKSSRRNEDAIMDIRRSLY